MYKIHISNQKNSSVSFCTVLKQLHFNLKKERSLFEKNFSKTYSPIRWKRKRRKKTRRYIKLTLALDIRNLYDSKATTSVVPFRAKFSQKRKNWGSVSCSVAAETDAGRIQGCILPPWKETRTAWNSIAVRGPHNHSFLSKYPSETTRHSAESRPWNPTTCNAAFHSSR